MAKLLLLRLNSAPRDEVPHLYAIDRIARTVQKLCTGQIDVPQSRNTGALLSAAVFHLGPFSTAGMMISDSSMCTIKISSSDSSHILAAAAFLGKSDVVASLLRKGVDVDTNSAYFGFPLRAAAGRGHVEVMRLLLEQGANVSNTGGLALHCHGEDTALQAASRRGDDTIVRLLSESIYGLQTAGVAYENAVLDAARHGHVNLVNYMLDRYNSANRKGLQSEILVVAAGIGHLQLVQTMLDNGVDVNYTGFGYVHVLTEAAAGGHALIVSLLLEKGALFNSKGHDRGAINRAARYGHEDVVRVLLDNGADVNADSGSGFQNPLYEAAMSQHVSMMRLLLDRGADIKAFECGESAFDRAIMVGYEEVIRVLVEAGVDIDSTGYDGEPAPILTAMMYGQDRVVKLLLELGAKRVDPLTSDWAEKFLDGTYPKYVGNPPPLLRP